MGLSGVAGCVFCNHEEESFATTRRKNLQPRGEKFCNYEEENFATTRRLQNRWFLGDFESGGIASSRGLNYRLVRTNIDPH